MQRYFLPTVVENQFTLPADINHHLATVLRAVIGTKAEFVLPDQTVFIGQVIAKESGALVLEKLANIDSHVELPVAATIIAGVPKGDKKAELVVQKATELGVTEIIFVATDWSVAKWDGKAAKKIERLQKIANGAAEQAHRTIIPTIKYVPSLTTILALTFDHKLIAWEEAAKDGEKATLAQVLADTQYGETIACVFGPEGGLSPKEVAQLTTIGYQVAGLGPRILRTETAPLYWLSAISFAMELA